MSCWPEKDRWRWGICSTFSWNTRKIQKLCKKRQIIDEEESSPHFLLNHKCCLKDSLFFTDIYEVTRHKLTYACVSTHKRTPQTEWGKWYGEGNAILQSTYYTLLPRLGTSWDSCITVVWRRPYHRFCRPHQFWSNSTEIVFNRQ